jgi:hypothetical protein
MVWNGTNYFTDGGHAILGATPLAPVGTESWTHTPDRTNFPVSVYIDVGLKASSSRDVQLWTFGTNDVKWSYQVTVVGEKPMNQVTLPYSTAGWGVTNIALTNDLQTPYSYRVWVVSYHTNYINNATYSYLHVPTDYTVKIP